MKKFLTAISESNPSASMSVAVQIPSWFTSGTTSGASSCIPFWLRSATSAIQIVLGVLRPNNCADNWYDLGLSLDPVGNSGEIESIGQILAGSAYRWAGR